MKTVSHFAGILLLLEACSLINANNEWNPDTLNNSYPVIVITWNYKDAMKKGIFEIFEIFNCINLSSEKDMQLSANLKILLLII